jgi:hypothetical protein
VTTIMICARSVSSVSRGRIVCVSGSPNRTLYSSTLGPLDVNMNPVKRRPTNGYPGCEMARFSALYHPFACRQWLVADKFCGFRREWLALRLEPGHSNPYHPCLVLDLHRKPFYDLALGERIRWCSHRRRIVYLSHCLGGILRLRPDRLKIRALPTARYRMNQIFHPPLFP